MTEKCEMNDKPKPVIDKKTNKVMTCKDFRKLYGKCVYESEVEKECDVTIIGKRGRIRTVTYSEYLEIMKPQPNRLIRFKYYGSKSNLPRR